MKYSAWRQRIAKISLLTAVTLATPVGLANANPDAAALSVAQALGLSGHIEGGFFKRTYQADDKAMIATDSGERYLLTSIFYMLTRQSPTGHFHLNQSDIVHYYHLGDPIRYSLIHPDGRWEEVVMGPDVINGQLLQLTVKGGVWKASLLLDGHHGFGLISEAVAPGFDYADMTLGSEETLRKQFPQHWDKVKEKIKAH